METKEEDFLEMSDYIKDVNYEGFITMATSKYSILKKSGKCVAKSLEEEKIVVLWAELNNLKSKLKLSKNLDATTGGGGAKQTSIMEVRIQTRKTRRIKKSTRGRKKKKHERKCSWTGMAHKAPNYLLCQ